MGYNYDENNIFAKILRGEIPNKTVLETAHSLAFEDISPAAPVHILIIPKGHMFLLITLLMRQLMKRLLITLGPSVRYAKLPVFSPHLAEQGSVQ